MKSIKEIVKCVADREGKKSSVSTGNIREIISIISDMMVEYPDMLKVLLANGKRRAKLTRK